MASKIANKATKNGTHWFWPSMTCISIGLFGYSNISNYNKYKLSLKQFETEIINLKQTNRLQNEQIMNNKQINTNTNPITTTSTNMNTQNNDEIIRNSYSNIIKSISPAIVNLVIESESTINYGFFHVQQPMKSLGTGVIIRNDGIIVTNNHVVTNKDLNSNDQTITVYLSNNRKVTAHCILQDALNDLALLKIDNFNSNEIFPFIEINNNICSIEVGDKVLAIGNQIGLHNTVTDGIISAIGRAQASHIDDKIDNNNSNNDSNNQTQPTIKISNNPYLPFIQTNAAINQGSSGGPLIDLNGKLIGINTAIASPFGINIGIAFAIPSNYVLLLLNSLNKPYIYNGQIIRPWDGLNINKEFINIKYLSNKLINKLNKLNISNNNNYIDGVKIIHMHTQSPAKKAGIQFDDILIMINDIKIDSQDKYWMILNSFKPNENVKYLVLRYNEKINEYELFEYNVIIQMPPQSTYNDIKIKDSKNILNQCVFGELQPALGIELGINPCKEGVMLMEMPYSSIAAHSGLKTGDLFLQIDGIKINNVQQLKQFNLNRNQRHNIVIQRGEMIGELNL